VHDDGEDVPPFFLSYAHAPEGQAGTAIVAGVGQHVEEFFKDLAVNVRHQIHLQAGVPAGFMDREMRGGMYWTDELLHAVGTCQVLVALLSAEYLTSPWCRMEWHAFAQRGLRKRPEAKPPPRQGCIIPVLWAPFHERVPKHMENTQLFSPDRDPEPRTPDHYKYNGVFGLLRMNRLRDSYEIVTWQLALHIAHIIHSQQTESRQFQVSDLIVSPGGGHGG
jgi:hypothetical protein